MHIFVWQHGPTGIDPVVYDADMMAGRVEKLHGVIAKVNLPASDEGLAIRDLAKKYAYLLPRPSLARRVDNGRI